MFRCNLSPGLLAEWPGSAGIRTRNLLITSLVLLPTSYSGTGAPCLSQEWSAPDIEDAWVKVYVPDIESGWVKVYAPDAKDAWVKVHASDTEDAWVKVYAPDTEDAWVKVYAPDIEDACVESICIMLPAERCTFFCNISCSNRRSVVRVTTVSADHEMLIHLVKQTKKGSLFN